MKMAFELASSKSSRARGLGGLAYIGAPVMENSFEEDTENPNQKMSYWLN